MISKKVEMLLNLVATVVAAEHQAENHLGRTIDGWEHEGYMVLDDIGVMLNELVEGKLK